jgi:hypothetical protein
LGAADPPVDGLPDALADSASPPEGEPLVLVSPLVAVPLVLWLLVGCAEFVEDEPVPGLGVELVVQEVGATALEEVPAGVCVPVDVEDGDVAVPVVLEVEETGVEQLEVLSAGALLFVVVEVPPVLLEDRLSS